jgi:ADP-ribosylglycohydrolase
MDKEKISASLVLGSYLDTLGFRNSKWEFNFNYEITNNYDAMFVNYYIVTEFFSLGGFDIDLSNWIASDDTIMMIATKKACLKGASEKNFIDEYLKIYPLLLEKKRVSGLTTLESLKILSKYKDPSKIKYNDNMGGNGAAMRTHYIGIHFKNDINKTIETSIIASKLTHYHPLGFLSGMTTAVFANFAINNIVPWEWCNKLIELELNGTIDKIVEKIINDDSIYSKYLDDKNTYWIPWFKYKEKRNNKFDIKTPEFIYGPDRFADLFDVLYTDKQKINYNKFGFSGVSSVITALDSILLSILPNEPNGTINLKKEVKYSWQNLIILSTLHFGDNDTIGAITGMLYGALRGYDGVSKDVINMLEFKKELL